MASVVPDLVSLLEAAPGLGLVYGQTIFKGPKTKLPSGLGPFVSIIRAGGRGEEGTHNSLDAPAYERPTCQLVCRSTSYEAAETLSDALWAYLWPIQNQFVNGTWWREVRLGDPIDLPPGEDGMARRAFTVTPTKRTFAEPVGSQEATASSVDRFFGARSALPAFVSAYRLMKTFFLDMKLNHPTRDLLYREVVQADKGSVAPISLAAPGGRIYAIFCAVNKDLAPAGPPFNYGIIYGEVTDVTGTAIEQLVTPYCNFVDRPSVIVVPGGTKPAGHADFLAYDRNNDPTVFTYGFILYGNT